MTDRVPGRNPFEPSLEQLPETLPIFPLSGVLLLPGGKLPLNIFEPRYLAMIFDSLAGHRMIGMVQPMQPGGYAGDGLPTDDGRPKVHKVGCAGRIVSFNETEDGRLLLALSGVCRFEIGRELDLAEKAKEAGPVDDLKAKAAADPKDMQSRLDLAMAYWAADQKQEAIDELLAMIKLDRNWNEAAARQQLLKFFEALGFADPLSVAGRKRLSTILFS